MAEGVGFEPTKVSLAGFQDRCTRPLCESSVGEATRDREVFKNQAVGRSSRPSIAIATPSSSHGPAMLLAYLAPSGWPEDIA